MSQDHSTKVLLQIKGPNITDLVVHEATNGSLQVLAKLTYRARCGKRSMVKNGFKTVHIRIPRISEPGTILNLKKQRFICKNCGKSSLATTTLVKKHHQISENSLHATDLSLTEDRTMASIAVDAQTHDIITILPGRKTADIKDFFLNHYSKSHRDRVTRVVIDFNFQYQPAIRTLFLHAKLVADNFHLVQMALRSLNQTRGQLMKRFNPKSREYRVLKYYWRLYLKDYDSLEKRNPQWFAHLKDRMTQEQLVVAGLNLDQQFRQTYQAAHALVTAFQKRDYRSFKAALGNIENVSPQLMTNIKSFIKNRQLIKNMTTGRLSNGPVEDVNRKIKQIKRTPYGYKNWQNFIYRIQIEFKIKIEKRIQFVNELDSKYNFINTG